MNSNFLQTKGDDNTIIGVDKSPFGEILICIESSKSREWIELNKEQTKSLVNNINKLI
jgi:hypothetical protein